MSREPAAGGTGYRILIVEDDPLDAELMVEQMRQEGLGFRHEVVANAQAFCDRLECFQPDVVLSDLALPGFSGYRALELLLERQGRKPPFIFVSGTIGEAAAIEALRAGATDYVLKHNLARLASAVTRAVAEAKEREARDNAEAELIRAQRFETLAILTGSLGHDLRNTLQPVLLASQLIQAKSDGNAELVRLGKLIRECCDQGLELISAMLGLARGGDRQPGRPARLAALLDAVAMLLKPSMPASVQLVIEADDPHLEVPGNVTECRQCLLNLALNAVQAMPDGGTVTLSAQRRELAAGDFADGESGRPGTYVLVSVADTGIGMDQDTQARLFTPFFTSKAEGNGLGLISCRRFVDNQQGFIRLHSQPGQGTRFDLYLPLKATAEGDAGHCGHGMGGLEGQGQRIVVISDDGAIRDDLIDILMLYDYQALLPGQLGKGPPPVLVIVDAQTGGESVAEAAGILAERGFAGRILVLGQGRPPPALATLGTISGRLDRPVLARPLLQRVAAELAGGA